MEQTNKAVNIPRTFSDIQSHTIFFIQIIWEKYCHPIFFKLFRGSATNGRRTAAQVDIVFDLVSMDVVSGQVDSKVSEAGLGGLRDVNIKIIYIYIYTVYII